LSFFQLYVLKMVKFVIFLIFLILLPDFSDATFMANEDSSRKIMLNYKEYSKEVFIQMAQIDHIYKVRKFLSFLEKRLKLKALSNKIAPEYSYSFSDSYPSRGLAPASEVAGGHTLPF
jgi:hypothetical protein